MKHIITILSILLSSIGFAATSYILRSPDGKLEIEISAINTLTYQLSYLGEIQIEKSEIGLESNRFSARQISHFTPIIEQQQIEKVNLLWGTTLHVESVFNQLIVSIQDSLQIEFRAYNEGFAYRFISPVSSEVIIYSETAQIIPKNDAIVYSAEAKGFSTPFENNYLPYYISQLTDQYLSLTPLLIKSKNGTNVLVSEADLFAYPGMFLQKNNNGFQAVFPKFPIKETEQLPGRLRLTSFPQLSKKMVRKTEDYIARRTGQSSFPWRVFIVSDSDKSLLTNNLIALLSQKAEISSFDWVKPGKVVWDWYNHMNLTNVSFEPGINTNTYKYMIDFASKNGIEYINIDDGWCKLHNFKKINKNLDLEQVLAYADSKNTGVFIWCTWQTLEHDLESNLDYFKKMGIAGLKVDFFDRCDQKIVDFINHLASECAKRELLLNLHGMYKPTGIEITWPNVVNLEGVLGLEYNKFSDKCTPVHNLTIPFVRNVVGPMDYTPGAMFYSEPDSFEKSWKFPKAMSTRTQQLAMYVIYHGGVQMLSEAVTAYESDSIALEFLSAVPVSFDESVALDAVIGEKICIARRKGTTWYIGAMAGEKEESVSLLLNFLPEGSYEMTLLENGNLANEMIKKLKSVNSKSKIDLKLNALGGMVAVLKLKN